MSSLYMPNILLYGEGPSDIQGSSSQQGALVCMTVQTLKELASELCHHGSWLAPFVDDWTSQELQAHSLAADKQEIKALVPTLKGRARGVFGSELALFFNEAYALGKIALAKHLDLAFFFHDADFTDTDSIYRRIRAGFDHAGFEKGVIMVPVPTSEAWVLAAWLNLFGEEQEKLTPSNGASFEDSLRPNDRNPHSAKAILAQRVSGNTDARALNRDDYKACIESIDRAEGWAVIEYLPSGSVFRLTLKEALKKYLSELDPGISHST